MMIFRGHAGHLRYPLQCGRCRGERGAIVPGRLLVNLSRQQPVACAPGTGPKLLRRSAAPQDVPGETLPLSALSTHTLRKKLRAMVLCAAGIII